MFAVHSRTVGKMCVRCCYPTGREFRVSHFPCTPWLLLCFPASTTVTVNIFWKKMDCLKPSVPACSVVLWRAMIIPLALSMTSVMTMLLMTNKTSKFCSLHGLLIIQILSRVNAKRLLHQLQDQVCSQHPSHLHLPPKNHLVLQLHLPLTNLRTLQACLQHPCHQVPQLRCLLPTCLRCYQQ